MQILTHGAAGGNSFAGMYNTATWRDAMRKKKFMKGPDPWKLFEDLTLRSLEAQGLSVQQENMDRPQGVNKVSQGRYDFKILTDPPICFDCKSVSVNSRVTLPPMTSSLVKTHQLKALRAEMNAGAVVGLLIEYRKLGRIWWLSLRSLDKLIAEHGLLSSILPHHCDKYGIEVPIVGGLLKFDTEAIWADFQGGVE